MDLANANPTPLVGREEVSLEDSWLSLWSFFHPQSPNWIHVISLPWLQLSHLIINVYWLEMFLSPPPHPVLNLEYNSTASSLKSTWITSIDASWCLCCDARWFKCQVWAFWWYPKLTFQYLLTSLDLSHQRYAASGTPKAGEIMLGHRWA